MLLEMTIIGGLFILLYLMFRILFKHRVPAVVFLLFGIIIITRLLLPLTFERNVQVFDLNYAQISQEFLTTTVLESTIGDNYTHLPQLIWLAGSLIAFIYFVIGHIKLKKKLRFSTLTKDVDLNQTQNVKLPKIRKIKIYTTDECLSPFTLGIFFPKIYLPSTFYEKNVTQQHIILTHEIYHIKRLDSIWKFLGILVAITHWFNPLIWIFLKQFNIDLETSCDSWVIKKFNARIKKNYANMLLHESGNNKKSSRIACYFAKGQTTQRIEAIIKQKNSPLFSALTLAFMPIFLIIGFTFYQEILPIAKMTQSYFPVVTMPSAESHHLPPEPSFEVIDSFEINWEVYPSDENVSVTFLSLEETESEVARVTFGSVSVSN